MRRLTVASRRASAVLLLALATALAGAGRAHAQEAPYRIIVNSKNPVASLPRDDVSKMFMKKILAWPSGETVQPVDQAEDTDVRRVFSKRVLGRDVAAVKGYWQQAIFTGRSFPPVEKASDGDVAAFVASTPSAIGYVSSVALLPGGVKVVKVEN